MPNYKLSEIAEADLVRIYRWGLQRYGQAKRIGISLRSSIILINSLNSRSHIQ